MLHSNILAEMWDSAGVIDEAAPGAALVDQAAEAMLVSVHPWDTDGARRAGLSAAWVNRAGVDYPSYFRAPSVEVESLIDLVDRLS
jgi:FMN phosphatase YigB (HAD superfamily)